MAGHIVANDIVILDGPILPAWDTELFKATVNLKLADEAIERIKIGHKTSAFNCSSESFCELIDAFISLVGEDGLKALEIIFLDHEKITNIEDALLARLKQKCANLESLAVLAH